MASVFSVLASPYLNNSLPAFFIRKLGLVSGLYTAGRVEWFLFLPPATARVSKVPYLSCYKTGFSSLQNDNTRSGNILSFLLPLFQEGQLSVTGESMCTKYWLTA